MIAYTTLCLVCNEVYEDDHARDIGVCPACRRLAEIGRRVEGMRERKADASFRDVIASEAYNDCLRAAKGEK